MNSGNKIFNQRSLTIIDPNIGIDIERQPYVQKKIVMAREQLSKVKNLDAVLTEIDKVKRKPK